MSKSETDPLDFTKSAAGSMPSAPAAPSKSAFYKPAIAKKLFELGGTKETVAAGENFFVEGDKSGKGGLFGKGDPNKMYFVNSGEVVLSIGGKRLDTIRPGEIFGEMAVITARVRTATAKAKTDCNVYAMSVEQFQDATQKFPDFAIMLMSVMFDRLRQVSAKLAVWSQAPGHGGDKGSLVFDKDILREIEAQIDGATILNFSPGQTIMREGEAGAYMYVIKTGKVRLSVNGNVVETASTGGAFGEMALVDQLPRTATAVAEQNSTLFAINRPAMLKLVKEHPEFGTALMRAVADRLRYMNSLIA